MTVPRHGRIGPDFDRRAIRADPRERQRRHDIDVGGKGRSGIARRALEDAQGRLYPLHGNPVLDEIRRAGETSGRLARDHLNRMDGTFGSSRDRIEADQGAGRHDDLAAMCPGEIDQIGTGQQRTGAEHHDLLAGGQHRPADLIEDISRRTLDNEVGVSGQFVQRNQRTGDSFPIEPGLRLRRSLVVIAARASPGRPCASLRATVFPISPSPAMAIRFDGKLWCSCNGGFILVLDLGPHGIWRGSVPRQQRSRRLIDNNIGQAADDPFMGTRYTTDMPHARKFSQLFGSSTDTGDHLRGRDGISVSDVAENCAMCCRASAVKRSLTDRMTSRAPPSVHRLRTALPSRISRWMRVTSCA